MGMITYTDKVALNINNDIPDENKVNASDMNMIKNVVNENETNRQNMIANTYINSQTNTYSTEYINTLQTYSTTEQRVGTWINNKPVYRRVFTLGTSILLNASWQTIFSVSGMNIEAITKLETLNNNDIAWNGTISRINNNNLQLYYIGVGGAEWYVGKVILEYTKTTD